MLNTFQQMGIAALLSLIVAMTPAAMGLFYALRPTEAKLVLVRPIALAGLFGGLSGFAIGMINALVWISDQPKPGELSTSPLLIGIAESLVTVAVAFASQTVAWLLVALGMRRQV